MLSRRERLCWMVGSLVGILQFPIAMVLCFKGLPPFGAAVIACIISMVAFRGLTWALGKPQEPVNVLGQK